MHTSTADKSQASDGTSVKEMCLVCYSFLCFADGCGNRTGNVVRRKIVGDSPAAYTVQMTWPSGQEGPDAIRDTLCGVDTVHYAHLYVYTLCNVPLNSAPLIFLWSP